MICFSKYINYKVMVILLRREFLDRVGISKKKLLKLKSSMF